MKSLEQVQREALALLRPRQGYAADVILGRQRWSGADLRGAARRWGAVYAQQRRDAARAWLAAGGDMVAVDHGLIVGGVVIAVGPDGCVVYETTAGRATQRAGRARLVR